jgi:hypothetical protein
VAEVFAFLSDLRNDPKWNSAVAEMILLTPEAPGKGARYRQAAPGLLGDKLQQQVEVIEYEPDRKLSFRASGPPFPFVMSYDFQAADHGTRLRLTGEMELPGLLVLLTPLVKSSVSGQTDSALRQLKRLLEGEASLTPAPGVAGG